MAITLNGNGTVTGVTTLPDGIVTNADLAGSIDQSKLAGSIPLSKLATTGTGSNSNFLRGDGAYAEAGGGAWEVVESVTVSSAVASVDFTTTSYFPSGSNSYAVTFSHVRPVTDGAQLHCRFGDSSGFYTDNKYDFHMSEVSSQGNSYAAQSGKDQTHMRLCPNQGNTVKEAFSATVYLHGMSDSNIMPVQTGTYTAGMDAGHSIGGYIFGSRIKHGDTGSATQRYQVYYSSGNIAAGKITLYKINIA